MRCFELPGPTLPASEPRTHSSPSPGLLRPRRAGRRRAGDASCRAQGSPRPPPSAQVGLGLQFQLRLRLSALLGFSAGHCLSSVPTQPSFPTPPQPFSPRPPSLSRSRFSAVLSFPPSLLSPPPFPSLSLLTSTAFPDSAQARASAWLEGRGWRASRLRGNTPNNLRLAVAVGRRGGGRKVVKNPGVGRGGGSAGFGEKSM